MSNVRFDQLPFVVPVGRAFKPRGGFSILYGNLAPDGCILKLAGKGKLHFEGTARVFESEEAAFSRALTAPYLQPDSSVNATRWMREE